MTTNLADPGGTATAERLGLAQFGYRLLFISLRSFIMMCRCFR